MNVRVREPAQAGRFYEADPARLAADVDGYLAAAEKDESLGRPTALISPHAGYVYSGQTAAWAYKQVAALPLRRAVVFAPSHSAAFDGAQVFDGDAYATPLGQIELDAEFLSRLRERSELVAPDSGRGDNEHSLEVQLPFLQRALDEFRLVPLVLSRLDGPRSAALAEAVAGVVAELGGADETLVVASSDLYHGYSYQECKEQDARLAAAVAAFDVEGFEAGCREGRYMACGAAPIALTMRLARRLGATRARPLHQTTSQDVTGGSGGYVVGYLAAALY